MGHKCKDGRLQKGRYVTINVTECPTFMFRRKFSNSEANIERDKLNVEIFLASKFVERYLYISKVGHVLHVTIYSDAPYLWTFAV